MITQGVQQFIENIINLCGKEHLEWGRIFDKVYRDTLENALLVDDNDMLFALTGDIPAMWQRDSTAQVRPYLIPAQSDQELAVIISKVIRRQLTNMIADPYANAFNIKNNGNGHQDDVTNMTPGVWERKYELDSLCYPMQLTYLYWKNTGRTDVFDEIFRQALNKMVTVIKQEQDHQHSNYFFERDNGIATDTLVNGVGTPVGITGMSWSGFRPSDDACEYGYLIPANLFAAKTLEQLGQIIFEVFHESESDLLSLATSLRSAVMANGVTKNKQGKQILAYETDGLGHFLVMDDANVPNLLSLPYLGAIDRADPIYEATRATVLSEENPYYYQSHQYSGIGSPHTPKQYIWPIGMAVAGLTTTDREVKSEILNDLIASSAGMACMHESFLVTDPTQYTRPWFSWANMMFCELVMDYFGFSIKQ